jgi:MarR family transcriptional regulator, organic hydroperoxide resistance regulator
MAKNDTSSNVGHFLTLAARRHRVRKAALLVEHGLFPGQDQVLISLGEVEAMTMTEIAVQLNIRPPTASKMIARMAAQGLVERRSKDEDARLVEVFITEAGKMLLVRLGKISKKVEKESLAGFDDKDERRLRRLLKKVAKNLGSQSLDGNTAIADSESSSEDNED